MQEGRFLKGTERGKDFGLNKLLDVMDEGVTSLIIHQKGAKLLRTKSVKKRREKLNKIYMSLSEKIYMGYPLSEMIGELSEYALLNFKSGEPWGKKNDIEKVLIDTEALEQFTASLEEEDIWFMRGYTNPLNDLLNIMEKIVTKLQKCCSFGHENERHYIEVEDKLRGQYKNLIRAYNETKGLSEIIEDLGKFIVLCNMLNKTTFHFS
jgi:hypothetical protein